MAGSSTFEWTDENGDVYHPIWHSGLRAAGAARRALRAAQHPARRDQPDIALRRFEAVDLAGELAEGAFDPRGYFVYLLFATDSDRPFYVGQSANIFGRLSTHTGTYGSRIASVQLIRCETRADQNATERALIAEHQPIENLRGVKPQRRDWEA